MIQFHYGGSPYEGLGVQWEPHESMPDLASTQDEFSLAVQDMGIVFNSQGERSAIRVADYDILYQAFEVDEVEHTYPGYIGAWLCDASNRLYIIYYATTPALAQENDLLRQFLCYIESFKCHD